MELLVLSLFCVCLVVCVVIDQSILLALGAGLLLFFGYGRYKGVGWRELVRSALSGVKSVRNILIAFVLIGMLTALWRDAGTIPTIVSYAANLIHPSIFVLMTFLLNCLVSVLTGTAFGASATMGVICVTMANTMGVSLVFTGGAVLAGAYFGDRCSPVSTSAMLVAELTKTDVLSNIKGMVRTCIVPFVAACGVYAVLGMLTQGEGQTPDLRGVFEREFDISWTCLLPAVVILILPMMKVGVKKAMAASVLTALPIALAVQGTKISELPRLLIMGYEAAGEDVGAMLNGGGIISMVRVGAIVCLSSSYSGLFRVSGLLDGARGVVAALARRTTPYIATLCTAIGANMISCNQTLGIMLTHQLCAEAEKDNRNMAIHLEDTAVVIAPLIPWSIAGAVSLSAAGAPLAGMAAACYLYLLPLWRLSVELLRKSRKK